MHNRSVPKRITFLLPYFPPDVAADGQLFALLARELAARGHRVQVLTYRPRYQGLSERAPRQEMMGGVSVRRWWAPGGKSLWARALGAWWLMCSGMCRALFCRGTLIVPSSPPGLALAAWQLSLLGRRYVYVLHDIHPELGLALGALKPGAAAALVRLAGNLAMGRARAVVTLTEGMKQVALARCPRAFVEVQPNWVDLDAITPRPREPERGAPLIIQYSGNMGHLHDLEGLTRAAGRLAGVELHYVGRGVRLEEIKALARREQWNHVKFFDYRPLSELAASLGACDVAAIALSAGADRLAMPSKLQGILASGRPLLCLAGPDTELGALVDREAVGLTVKNPADTDEIAAAIERLRDPELRLAMGQRARRLAEDRYGVQRAADVYERLA
ncbi:glycosyltransferase WbuB [bacterium]|nr:MAG: glycosyltransferase WbuB [bacterium]RIK62222.1 MAG: hypothetical protein DCC64_10760 [Planctomycetota bacterium]